MLIDAGPVASVRDVEKSVWIGRCPSIRVFCAWETGLRFARARREVRKGHAILTAKVAPILLCRIVVCTLKV